MKVAYFTERPYRWVNEETVLKNRAFFAVSNSNFDRQNEKGVTLSSRVLNAW